MFFSANVQFELSSTVLHIALKLNSHLEVQLVNITDSFYLYVSDSLSGFVVFSLPIPFVFISLRNVLVDWMLAV